MAMKWESAVLTCARAVNEQPKSMAEKNKDSFMINVFVSAAKLTLYYIRYNTQNSVILGTADIFRGFMVSLYVKGKENGESRLYEMKQHIQSTENIH